MNKIKCPKCKKSWDKDIWLCCPHCDLGWEHIKQVKEQQHTYFKYRGA